MRKLRIMIGRMLEEEEDKEGRGEENEELEN
jgi:hypothetical protein